MALMRYLHPHLGEITLSESSRARRINLSVKLSGEVRLSFPRGVSMERLLAFLGEQQEWVEQSRKRMAERRAQNPPHTYSKEEIEQLRCQAKAVLPRRVAELAAHFGFRYGRITIRSPRTKWASCTSKGNLSLSLFLMTLPEALRDFVLLHELCHTVHHNHSERFHALLDRCVGGRERELQRALKNYHP